MIQWAILIWNLGIFSIIRFKCCILAGFLWYSCVGWKEWALSYYCQVGQKLSIPLVILWYPVVRTSVWLLGWMRIRPIMLILPWLGTEGRGTAPHCSPLDSIDRGVENFLLQAGIKVPIHSSDTTLVGELGHLAITWQGWKSGLMTWFFWNLAAIWSLAFDWSKVVII